MHNNDTEIALLLRHYKLSTEKSCLARGPIRRCRPLHMVIFRAEKKLGAQNIVLAFYLGNFMGIFFLPQLTLDIICILCNMKALLKHISHYFPHLGLILQQVIQK